MTCEDRKTFDSLNNIASHQSEIDLNAYPIWSFGAVTCVRCSKLESSGTSLEIFVHEILWYSMVKHGVLDAGQ